MQSALSKIERLSVQLRKLLRKTCFESRCQYLKKTLYFQYLRYQYPNSDTKRFDSLFSKNFFSLYYTHLIPFDLTNLHKSQLSGMESLSQSKCVMWMYQTNCRGQQKVLQLRDSEISFPKSKIFSRSFEGGQRAALLPKM